jgi:hypothetical protein
MLPESRAKALAQAAFEQTKLPTQGAKDAIYEGVCAAASWATGATSRGGDVIFNDGHAMTKATADMCAAGPTGTWRFGVTRVMSCYELRMHVPAANARYCATAAWITRFLGFIMATWELAQSECAFPNVPMDMPTILDKLARCVKGSFAALCPLSRVEVTGLLTRTEHIVPSPPVPDNNNANIYMFCDSIAECHTMQGKHTLNRDREGEYMGYPMRHYNMDVEAGMSLTSVTRKVDQLIRTLNSSPRLGDCVNLLERIRILRRQSGERRGEHGDCRHPAIGEERNRASLRGVGAIRPQSCGRILAGLAMGSPSQVRQGHVGDQDDLRRSTHLHDDR